LNIFPVPHLLTAALIGGIPWQLLARTCVSCVIKIAPKRLEAIIDIEAK
tara:strand:- start:972 stop:1118 length:147 start_codon:yes stop_codon:yes gene_type:complete